MSNSDKIKKELYSLRDPIQAALLQGFFKTGPGEYGEGDIFLGIKVPIQRKVAKNYLDLNLKSLKKLLESKIHEHRFISLVILAEKFKKSKEDNERKKIFDFYIENTKHINNWDLVDVTCNQIVGRYLQDKNRDILFKMARSKNMWERRIAIVSTSFFINNYDFQTTLHIAEILINDKHDLIHKAVGWMLREIGKRDQNVEEIFLKKYYKKMPRTMLRYAIEKFDIKKRRLYMKK